MNEQIDCIPYPVGEKFKNWTGMTNGTVTVLGYVGKDENEIPMWKCKCDCDKEKGIYKIFLSPNRQVKNKNKSCGCRSRHKVTHDKTYTREYMMWEAIKERCYNKNVEGFHLYGGRGIKMCDRWLNSIENFINDIGKRPTKYHTFDRIDVNGDYCPENFRWATPKEQANNRRNNRLIKYNNEELTVTQWAEKIGTNSQNLFKKIDDGWSIEEILTRKYIKRNKLWEYKGEKRTLKEWCNRLQLRFGTIRNRLYNGWSIEMAFETPIRNINRSNI